MRKKQTHDAMARKEEARAWFLLLRVQLIPSLTCGLSADTYFPYMHTRWHYACLCQCVRVCVVCVHSVSLSLSRSLSNTNAAEEVEDTSLSCIEIGMSFRALWRRKKDSRLDDKRQTLIFDARVSCNIQLEMPFLSPTPSQYVGRDVKKKRRYVI